MGDRVTKYTISAPRRRRANQKQEARKPPQRVAKAPRFRGNPFLPAYAGQKFLPPGSLALSRFSRRATVGACENRSAAPAAASCRTPDRPQNQTQTVKKVPSSRHVRMDGTHTGKFGAESVRAALRRVRGSAPNFVPRGILGGRNFCPAYAGRNGFPLKRGAFATR